MKVSFVPLLVMPGDRSWISGRTTSTPSRKMENVAPWVLAT